MPEELDNLAREIRNLELRMVALYQQEGSFVSAELLELSERIDVLVTRHLALQIEADRYSRDAGTEPRGTELAAPGQ